MVIALPTALVNIGCVTVHRKRLHFGHFDPLPHPTEKFRITPRVSFMAIKILQREGYSSNHFMSRFSKELREKNASYGT